VRCVLARREIQRTVIVIAQRRTKIRVRAVVDHNLRALFWRLAAQIGQALLGDQYLYIMLGVVDVRHHGYDAGNRSVLGD